MIGEQVRYFAAVSEKLAQGGILAVIDYKKKRLWGLRAGQIQIGKIGTSCSRKSKKLGA